jgi:predicted neuraminidase
MKLFPLARLAVLTALLPSIPVSATEIQPGVVLSEFIYEAGPYPQVHASTLAETPSGLVAAWFGGTAEGKNDVCIHLSRHRSGRWSQDIEVANGIQTDALRHPSWNPVLFQPKQGPLMLFYKVGRNPRDWWGELKTSTDQGDTWSTAQKLPPGFLGPVKNKPVELPNGDILCASSTETAGSPEKWSVHFERTGDHGKTWTRTDPVNDGIQIQSIQPSILFLPDSRLKAIGRTRQNRIFEVTSDDWGLTWSTMELGALPNNNSGTDAVTLPDGRHLIVYNHVAGTPGKWGGKRSPLNVAVSTDARNWHAAIVLESEPGEYSYPAVILSKDGLVHISYTWKRQRIKHVVIDPAKLITRPILDGVWPQ